jgi:pseudaminic acid biosynthesis-associated methylase
MMKLHSQQEAFWAGEFGDAYIARNDAPELLASYVHLLSNALQRAGRIHSAIEFGANIGLNMHALRTLRPKIDLAAIEINERAVARLSAIDGVKVFHGSIVDAHAQKTYDLSFVAGVLIHLAPELLPQVYRRLYEASHRYILVSEYYNPAPVMIPYRGHDERLYKRDFAGEMLDAFPGLKLIDYGFQYRRDPNFPHDDVTWFLMEKTA